MPIETPLLYESKGSPNARRVRVFIAEKGIEIARRAIDLGSREQFSDAFKAVNPRMQVPALQLADGTVITEVLAIWRYLEEAYPHKPLLGATAKDKALVTMWERRAELDGFAPVMEAVRNALPGLKGRALSGPHDYEQIPALVERSKQRVSNFFADFNARLESAPFVAGDEFSAADITTLVTVDFAANALKMPIPESHQSFRRWYESISSRPASSA
ncbi:glutathione S-transferase [Paraburkholderia sp. SEWSISQ10-3 4]|uniref:glutathione S-transferase family protein n=1 Tax=Paraburkholderia TaxID=1822464 RepID=UPI002251B9C9|nr:MULTISPECIES: glutathione S-transferase [Paraburkholderia]MCX4142109.1 glutathione S-transferase [Paraburkholderia aspalathi]MDN7174789.1 glutathione S-transferase [Paraburkholderia sp. SEWSISQ10-3 4]MDQ6504430.1 glutathione S-transferase [Paraburkholderia aspalathi]